MRIKSYQVSNPPGGLKFPSVNFRRLNLIVGDTGTGKTKLLNTIFNCGLMAISSRIFHGSWRILFDHQGTTYRWQVDAGTNEQQEDVIISEELARINGDSEAIIVDRNLERIIFNDTVLPKLAPNLSSIFLLREEDLIRPVYNAFSLVKRRDFSGPALSEASVIQELPEKFLTQVEKNRSLDKLFRADTRLSATLYVLSRYFKEVFNKICDTYKSIFPFIADIKMLQATRAMKVLNLTSPRILPVFSIKEKDIDDWIPLNEMSAGMIKVLLVIVDTLVVPDGGLVYMLDEYENSLGLSAINSFSSFVNDVDPSVQFIITSHHPYIISNIPTRDWTILHRKGVEVMIRQGQEIEKRFSKSKQKSFVQLINDPFFLDGVE